MQNKAGDMEGLAIGKRKPFTLTHSRINAIKELIANKEGRLEIDIDDQEVFDYLKDMARAHGSIRNYFDWVHAADIS